MSVFASCTGIVVLLKQLQHDLQTKMNRSLATPFESTADAVNHVAQVRVLLDIFLPERPGMHAASLHAAIAIRVHDVYCSLEHSMVLMIQKTGISSVLLQDMPFVTQAMKLVEQYSRLCEIGQRLCEIGQRLKLDVSQDSSKGSDVHQMRMRLCASMVQLLVPITCVSDINCNVIAAFRKTALMNGLR